MEERIRMFLEHESGNWSVSEICRRYGICRDTFYEWRKRKETGDPAWFEDRSHAPLQCWQTTDDAIAEKVIAARGAFRIWGRARFWRYSSARRRKPHGLRLRRSGIFSSALVWSRQ
jgi:transposase-like protein